MESGLSSFDSPSPSTRPVLPVGVNYLPPDCRSAAEWWVRWNDHAERVRRDLDAIAQAGLTAVRVENPDPLESHATAWAEFVRECGERSLWIVSSTTTGSPVEISTRDRVSVEFRAYSGEHPLAFDGLTDAFGHTFLPFAVRLAAREGPAFVASLGIGGVLSAQREETWLRAVLPATAAAGAVGVFWCAWRGPDGLLDADGRLHSGRTYLGKFAREVRRKPSRPADPEVGLFIARGSPSMEDRRRALLAHYFVSTLGTHACLVDETTLRTAPCRTVLIPGTTVPVSAMSELQAWTTAGGRLCWHGPDFWCTGEQARDLFGVALVDRRSARGISVQAFGERFTLAHFPGEVRAELEPRTARVLAQDQQGLPVLCENLIGRGCVRFMLPIVEEAIVPIAAHPTSRDRWQSWYRGMLAD